MATRIRRSVLAALLLGTSFSLASCGSDEGTGTQPTTHPPPIETLDFGIFKVKVVSGVDAASPLQGFMVALDQGSKRVEKLTDANGIATFVGVYPKNGAITVTSYKPGYQLVSAFDAAELASDTGIIKNLQMLSTALDPKLAVASGFAQHMHDFADQLYVSADIVPSTQHQGKGSMWMIKAPARTFFNLVAFEFQPAVTPETHSVTYDVFGWVGRRAATGSGINLDFNQSLAPEKVVGTIPALKVERPVAGSISHGGIYEPGATAFIKVMGAHETPLLGVSTKTILNQRLGVWEYTAEFVRALPESEVIWQLTQTTPYAPIEGAATSSVTFTGYPMSGEFVDDLPSSPVLLKNGTYKLDETISWTSKGGHQVNGLQIRSYGTKGPVIWNIMVTGRRSSLKLPALPSSANFEQVLPPNVPLAVSARHCEVDPAFHPWLCKAESVSRSRWILQ